MKTKLEKAGKMKISDWAEAILGSLCLVMVATVFLYLLPTLVYKLASDPNCCW